MASLLSIPPTSDQPSAAISLPTEAFSAARRALGNLRSRVEEVCREEVDKITHAGTQNQKNITNVLTISAVIGFIFLSD